MMSTRCKLSFASLGDRMSVVHSALNSEKRWFGAPWTGWHEPRLPITASAHIMRAW
jgi:hypothetical protein